MTKNACSQAQYNISVKPFFRKYFLAATNHGVIESFTYDDVYLTLYGKGIKEQCTFT